jgi:hypothetical protein
MASTFEQAHAVGEGPPADRTGHRLPPGRSERRVARRASRRAARLSFTNLPASPRHTIPGGPLTTSLAP